MAKPLHKNHIGYTHKLGYRKRASLFPGYLKCNTNTNSWLCANDSWGVLLAVTTCQTTTLLYYRFVFSFQRIYFGIRWLIIKKQSDNIPKCEILRVIPELGTLSTKALTSGTSKRATGSWYFLYFLVLELNRFVRVKTKAFRNVLSSKISNIRLL